MHDSSRRLSQSALRGRDPMRAQSTAVTPRPGLILLHKGDPCFATPVPVVRAAAEAIEQGFTHYPPPGGDRQLREALAEHVSQRAARRYTSDEILITVGATEALALPHQKSNPEVCSICRGQDMLVEHLAEIGSGDDP
jgi:aspartate/methionine/tyrosine aminotransferase